MTKLQAVNDEALDDTAEKNSVRTPGSCSFIYKKRFKHFRDENVYNAICQICHSLGGSDELVLLLDHFLEVFRSSPVNRKEVAFLINEIVRGTIKQNDLQLQGILQLF